MVARSDCIACSMGARSSAGSRSPSIPAVLGGAEDPLRLDASVDDEADGHVVLGMFDRGSSIRSISSR